MVNGKIIKICGMREAENIREVEALGIDMMGFIFYPKSPRCVYELPAYLPTSVHRVGVFVNEQKDTIKMYADRFELEYIQLHGKESPEYCHSLQATGLKIIKTLSIFHAKDLKDTDEYEEFCDYLLFDTKSEQYGGSGNQFDWSILDAYKGKTPFLLSGGLNCYSGKALNEFKHPCLAGYDLNSRFETEPGKKDIKRILQLIKELESF